VVIKIPPFHKVIGGLHLLNISPNQVSSGLRMRLDLVHPADGQLTRLHATKVS
jgi:hypothetical protein